MIFFLVYWYYCTNSFASIYKGPNFCERKLKGKKSKTKMLQFYHVVCPKNLRCSVTFEQMIKVLQDYNIPAADL